MVVVSTAAKQHPSRQRQRFQLAYLLLSMMILSLLPMWIMWNSRNQEYDKRMMQQPEHRSFKPLLPANVPIPHARFEYLHHFNPLLTTPSDLAELRHCQFDSEFDWQDYFAWASRILDEKLPQFQASLPDIDSRDMEQEFVLEVLELYATFHNKCRFDTGYPFGPSLIPPASEMFQQAQRDSPSEFATCAIVISAFRDAPQLKRLIDAIHMPQHFIVIHVERRTSPEFLQQVQEIVSHYPNVVVVQFGTIIYRTDLISTIQLQLMKWFTASSLKVDYYIALNGAAYPLYSAQELARHLQRSNRSVWLGELTNAGSPVRQSQAGLLIGAKRLAYTRGNATKGTFRLSQSLIEQDGKFEMNISPEIHTAMSSKTVSGNQAVYSYETLEKLLSSPASLQLFALAKYACCGILEERTWIAAMHLIGLGTEALNEAGCMWQTWGGVSDKCQSSVNNAILTLNASTCFKVEDATLQRNTTEPLYIYGNQVMEYLVDAKNRGFLFARKFDSSSKESMVLLEDIRTKLHAD